ncbi:unnamed protein product, partial [Polarella glacialis]
MRPKKKMEVHSPQLIHARKFDRTSYLKPFIDPKIPEVGSRGLSYDPLETVLGGMKDMHGFAGPVPLVKMRRAHRQKAAPCPKVVAPARYKAPVTPMMHPGRLLSESLTPSHRSRRREEPTQRRLSISGFVNWCETTFGGILAAWEHISSGEGNVQRAHFVEVLSSRDYPMGELGAKTTFFFLDSDEDGVATWDDVYQKTQDVKSSFSSSGNGWDAMGTQAKFARDLRDQDPLEEHYFEHTALNFVRKGHSDFTPDDGRAHLVQRVWRDEPQVAQFLEYMFSEFGSIRMAFRIMDVTQSGSISKDDFRQCLKTLCSTVGTKTGRVLKPLEVHMVDLYRRHAAAQGLDASTRNLRVSDILDEPGKKQ